MPHEQEFVLEFVLGGGWREPRPLWDSARDSGAWEVDLRLAPRSRAIPRFGQVRRDNLDRRLPRNSGGAMAFRRISAAFGSKKEVNEAKAANEELPAAMFRPDNCTPEQL